MMTQPDPRTPTDTLRALALAEIGYWLGKRPSLAESWRLYAHLNEAREDMFLFRFSGNEVEIVEKPHFAGLELERESSGHAKRAIRYLAFFRLMLLHSGKRFDGILAMSMHDIPPGDPDVPFFGFQKKQPSPLILLPDIDAISDLFYASDYEDPFSYEEKSVSGIFIGATTGSHHNVESVAALSSQRLKSGVFFRDKPEVEFRLPRIIQCASPEAEQAIRDLGFGIGPGTWEEQFRHRFLISMDGNGATCSRMAISLKSNAVLLKYNSDHVLHYFHALRPYRHYLPIFRDEDVIAAIGAEERRPGLFSDIAKIGRTFHQDYLTAAACMDYTAELLEQYFLSFDIPAPARSMELGDRVRPLIFAMVHVEGHGDVPYAPDGWFGWKGSGAALEGFALLPVGLLDRLGLQYRAIDADGHAGDWRERGAFAGSRGRAARLHGFAARMQNHDFLRYYGRFTDGTEIGPLAAGAPCISPSGAPLEAIRIEIDATLCLEAASDDPAHWVSVRTV